LADASSRLHPGTECWTGVNRDRPMKGGMRRSGRLADREGTAVPGVKRAPGPSRVSRVRNVETVRHEALDDRAEVRGLRRRAVAAARLKLRAAWPGRRWAGREQP